MLIFVNKKYNIFELYWCSFINFVSNILSNGYIKKRKKISSRKELIVDAKTEEYDFRGDGRNTFSEQ